MELFPERDGNIDEVMNELKVDRNQSEWSSSLKGMETVGCFVYIFNRWLEASEWSSSLKGMETIIASISGTSACLTSPNGALP